MMRNADWSAPAFTAALAALSPSTARFIDTRAVDTLGIRWRRLFRAPAVRRRKLTTLLISIPFSSGFTLVCPGTNAAVLRGLLLSTRTGRAPAPQIIKGGAKIDQWAEQNQASFGARVRPS